MSTCSHRVPSSVNNNGARKIRKNRVDCELGPDIDTDIEFSEVTEKILLNISAVLDKDDLLDEFDIIPEESQSNRSPVFHADHKLAVESWCVPFLYQHSLQHFISTIVVPNYEKLKAKRNAANASNSAAYSNGNAVSLMTPAASASSSRAEERESVQNLNSTCKSCSKQVYYAQAKPQPQLTEIERLKRGHELTRILLLINPDLTTAWNFRRELFLNKRDYLDIELASELNFISLITSRKPKCLEAFSYRRWVVEEQLNPSNNEDGVDVNNSFIWTHPIAFFQNEVKFIERAATKYFSNYHAWIYRLYLLKAFMNTKVSHRLVTSEEKQMILDMEMNAANLWLQNHVSDHSGFHYRQQLLFEIQIHFQKKDDVNGIVKLYTDELKENCRMIDYFNGHESLWYHRRAVLKQFLNWANYYYPKRQQHFNEASPLGAGREVPDLKAIVSSVYLDEKRLVDCVRNEAVTVLGPPAPTSNNVSQISNRSFVNSSNAFDQTKNLKQLNLLYAQRHAKWCRYCFNWTDMLDT